MLKAFKVFPQVVVSYPIIRFLLVLGFYGPVFLHYYSVADDGFRKSDVVENGALRNDPRLISVYRVCINSISWSARTLVSSL